MESFHGMSRQLYYLFQFSRLGFYNSVNVVLKFLFNLYASDLIFYFSLYIIVARVPGSIIFVQNFVYALTKVQNCSKPILRKAVLPFHYI